LAASSPARLTPAEGRKFGLTLAGAFAVLALIAWWRGGARAPIVFGTLAGLFLLGGALLPTRLGPVQRAWMGMAHAISKVTTPIFMGVVYFLVITPAGLVRRLFGSNALRTAQGRASGWVDRRDRPRGDLSRQF
jgi:Saxitoxin biosynthesis operon protein SxtJ